jgi:hypothetical protein
MFIFDVWFNEKENATLPTHQTNDPHFLALYSYNLCYCFISILLSESGNVVVHRNRLTAKSCSHHE